MNSFGNATDQFAIHDPRFVRQNRIRYGRNAIADLAHANSLYISTGRYPVRGWLLMRREHYNELDTYATNLQLDIGNPANTDNVGTLYNLAIVQAQCVTRGIAADDDALYLVEITDGRGILSNKWFQFPTVSAYNIRSPAYPDTFQLDTMNDYAAAGAGSKTTWTWETMCQDLWEQMTQLGTWPGFPTGVAPSGTPEGYWFQGVSAFEALCNVLEHIGLTIACDLTQSTDPYTIVQPGAADTDFTDTQNKYGSSTADPYRLEEDLEWIDTGAARVPKTIKVLFRRRNEIYGTEETVAYRNDIMAHQWDTKAVHTITKTAPALFASASGTHYLWSDFTIRYTDSSDPLDADLTTAEQIAQEQVDDYFRMIYHQTLGRLNQTYTGALPFVTGSRVDGVCYYQDHRRGPNDRQGWKTNIVRGCNPPWKGIWDKCCYC